MFKIFDNSESHLKAAAENQDSRTYITVVSIEAASGLAKFFIILLLFRFSDAPIEIIIRLARSFLP